MNVAHWSHSQALRPHGEGRGRGEMDEAGRAVGQALGRDLEAALGIGIPPQEHWESPGGFASGERHDLI